MKNIVSVSLFCNNEHGNFTGSFSAVDIGAEELLKLDNNFWPPKEIPLEYHFERKQKNPGWGCDHVEGYISVAGKPFQIVGYKQGWGNECWDCVIMSPETAIEFMNHLKSLNVFTAEVAWVEILEVWDTPGALFDERHIPDLEKYGYQAP